MAEKFVIYNDAGRRVVVTPILGNESRPGLEALMLTSPQEGGEIFITFVREGANDDEVNEVSMKIKMDTTGVHFEFHPGIGGDLPHPCLRQSLPWAMFD